MARENRPPVFGSSENIATSAVSTSSAQSPPSVMRGSRDQVAAGVAQAVIEFGRRIPDDVAIVGYDSWEIFAADCRPH